MASSELAKRLHGLFVQLGYTWTIGGGPQTPTAEDFDLAIDKGREVLYTEPVPSQIEVGRLIIRHYRHGKFDVYLQIGEIND